MNEKEPTMRKPVAPIAAAATGLYIGLSAGHAGACDSAGEAQRSTSTKADIDVQVPDSGARVEEYWTRDRMRAAKPMPTPRITRGTASPAAEAETADEE